MSKDLHMIAQGLNGFAHPLRIKALVLFEREHSPSEISELLIGEPLGVVSYHVRMLRQYGLVEETRTAPRRGALEHFYRRTALAEILMDTLGELFGIPPRPKTKGRPPSAAKLAEREEERERTLLAALGVSPETVFTAVAHEAAVAEIGRGS
jgi:DNA-binding transcriptional ArsR family regulator